MGGITIPSLVWGYGVNVKLRRVYLRHGLDIIACKDGLFTFRYQDGKNKQMQTRTLPGTQFLGLILQHVLPKGFRRTRNFGFLHANSKSCWHCYKNCSS